MASKDAAAQGWDSILFRMGSRSLGVTQIMGREVAGWVVKVCSVVVVGGYAQPAQTLGARVRGHDEREFTLYLSSSCAQTGL